MTRCGYCGMEFDEAAAEKACRSCPMSGCRMVRCPRCGFESLPEPRWIRWLKNRRRKDVAER